ncbi:unnamed protein product [Sphagnum jensenii]|uniref:Uncharacterized protein n=1 Tax=Sphagnum jensenii TaxID=128206 RepID=A0ABP1AD12_9BRYO
MELSDQLEDPANNLKELTCYGSAHESLRSEVVRPEVDPSHLETVNEDELLFQWLMQPKPQELQIGEEIGKGGQAHVSLGKNTTRVKTSSQILWWSKDIKLAMELMRYS